MNGLPLRVLAVDDEAPSLNDLVFELESLETVGSVTKAADATQALRELRTTSFDAVFLDVRMPGLDGLELAKILRQFKCPPPVVFVTAYDTHAVEAFEIDAIDYLLKPVRKERLDKAIAKIIDKTQSQNATQTGAPSQVQPDTKPGEPQEVHKEHDPKNPFDEEMISIESGGRIRFINRREILYVAANGDYVRLHLKDANYLVRVAMSTLEAQWDAHGFVRIHRSYLVALAHIDEVRVETGRGYVVNIGGRMLGVSRRSATQLRARLVEDATKRSRGPN